MESLDYKYIEQLLDRYFEAQTSVEEERILRDFFAQADVPAHLRQWQQLFKGQKSLAEAHLTEGFDKRVLRMAGEEGLVVRARRITLRQRIRPLFKAAALVAFAIVIGTAVEHAMSPEVTSAEPIAASTIQDELDETETNALDIRSAKATEVTDTLKQRMLPN